MLVVSAVGYSTSEKEISITKGRHTVQNMEIVPESRHLDEVVVEASGVKRVQRSAYNAVAIDTREMKNTTKNLSEALKQLPGMKIRETGGVGSDMQMMLDGFSGNHVKVFIDGIPQEGTGQALDLNNIPVNFAERIEVYKGVVPVGFGTDALGGIINIVTNKHRRKWFVDASYSYGSFNTHKSYVHFGQSLNSGLTYEINAFQNYSDNDYYVNGTIHQDYMSVSASASVPLYLQWENFANYMQSFGKHSVTAMLGMSFIENRTFNVSGSITGNEDDLGFKKDDPLYAYFAYATATATKNISGGEEFIGRKLAYFGRATYDYDGKYMAQFSLRADAADSSVLPIDNRWGYFPAFSLGWTVSREKFMERTNGWLSHLKLRGSWGQNGTTASLGNYMYLASINSNISYPYTNNLAYNTGSSPSATGNNELKWETSEQVDIGLDARFLNDRLSFTFDWYKKKTKDLIITGITPSTIVGNTASPVNAGNVENTGVELELGWREQRGDFNYEIRANLATLKNEVTYVHESLDRINGAGFHTTQGITVFEEGYPAWYFRGYKVEGIDEATGNPIFADLDNNNTINESDRTMIGSGIPDFTYGITLSGSWKGIDMTVFGTGSQGNDIFACLTRGDRLQANILKEYYDDRWTPDHTHASRPRAGATDIEKYWVSDGVIFDGSYFKIKQIQLGYTLPKPVLNRIGLDNLRVYCSLEDFFTFTSYPGFDPEVTGSGNAIGVDKGYYPSSKKVVFGLNVTF